MDDKADRLHKLIGRVQDAAQQLTLHSTAGSSLAWNLPLWQSFAPIATHLGYGDYGRFREAFLAICIAIKIDLSMLPISKETVRANWMACIDAISHVFDAPNFGLLTHEVFAAHFSARNLETLDSISERFQASGLHESSREEMESALTAVRDVIEELKQSKKLDTRVASVLSHYLQQMEAVFSHVEDFGDDTFWKLYKETFATFVQVHAIIAELDNSEAVMTKVRVVMQKLASKTIAGVAIGADLATIGVVLWPALTS